MICEGCGEVVELGSDSFATIQREPPFSPSAGRVSIQDGNFLIQECADGSYGTGRHA
jgi:hypothetical protein